MLYYFNRPLGMIIHSSLKKSVEDTIRLNRYLLKAMQQVEEDNEQKIDSSVAYFNASIWSSTTIINLDDYCRLFESRSHL
jgi:hypothetical protein